MGADSDLATRMISERRNRRMSGTRILPPREGKLQQSPIQETRTFLGNVLVFLERYVDNFVYHFLLCLVTIALTIANVASICAGNVYESKGGAWSFFLGALIGYAFCDIPIQIFTGQVGLFLTFNWFDLLCDVAVCAAAFSSSRLHVVPVILCIKFLVNYTRYVQKLRLLVAVNKRVHKYGSLQMDLSFVTNRIIAMGLPSQGLPSCLYRNSIKDVSRFFTDNFPGAHLIVNMCDECSYSQSYFNQVHVCPTPDHEVPAMQTLLNLCRELEHFLTSIPNSVAAIHCKGGKGRTGLATGCWLLYSDLCNNAVEAIDLLARRRTDPALCGGVKTITTSCQLRLLMCFEEMLRRYGRNVPPHPRTVRLRRVTVSGPLQKLGVDVTSLWLRVSPPRYETAEWRSFDSLTTGHTDSLATLGPDGGDVVIDWWVTPQGASDSDDEKKNREKSVSMSRTRDESSGSSSVRSRKTPLSTGGFQGKVRHGMNLEILLTKKKNSSNSSDSEVPPAASVKPICKAWLHSDFLEIRQPKIAFPEKKTAIEDFSERYTSREPVVRMSEDGKTIEKIEVVLLGDKDFDSKSYRPKIKKIETRLYFDIVDDASRSQ